MLPTCHAFPSAWPAPPAPKQASHTADRHAGMQAHACRGHRFGLQQHPGYSMNDMQSVYVCKDACTYSTSAHGLLGALLSGKCEVGAHVLRVPIHREKLHLHGSWQSEPCPSHVTRAQRCACGCMLGSSGGSVFLVYAPTGLDHPFSSDCGA
jgi:hypothetical protein